MTEWEPCGRFVVPGQPASASRPRVQPGKRVIYSAAHMAWETKAAQLFRLYWRDHELTGPVRLDVNAVFERPNAWVPRSMGGALPLQTERDWTLLLGEGVYGRVPCHRQPHDVDNIAKLVMDALGKGGVLVDDRRVVELTVRKLWTAVDNDAPCVEVSVWKR